MFWIAKEIRASLVIRGFLVFSWKPRHNNLKKQWHSKIFDAWPEILHACIRSFLFLSVLFSITVLLGSLPFPFSERNLICMVRWRLRGIANTQSCNFMHHEKANTIQTIVLSKMHKLTTRSECADFEGARSQKRKQMIRKFPRIVSRENPKIVAFAN